jgi:phosphatidylinositol glycan class B
MHIMKYERYFFFVALALYVVAAWFTKGFYPDEHYSIIEFVAYKMGSVSPDEMNWLFVSRIRSAIQPFIAFYVIRALQAISLEDPYIQVFVLRLLTALLTVFSIRFFTTACRGMVRPEFHKAYLFLSYFIWFLPIINVRFMSETWSGIMLLNALAFLIKNNFRSQQYFLVGGLLGLSYLFRYQNAFFAFGLFLWLIFIRKEKIHDLAKLLASGLLVLLLGVLIDRWLYGEFVLSAWNYFYVNLVEDVASNYGTEAWWNYFYSIFRFGFFPISIPIIISFLLLIFKKPSNIFIWTILPFFIIHSIIPHKELRFVFPAINLVPIILLLAYQELNWDPGKWRKPGRLALRTIAWMLFAVNCIAAITGSLKPTNQETPITHHIRKHYGDQSIRLISYNDSNPYGQTGLMASFYMEKDMQDIRLGSLDELSDTLLLQNRVNLLVLKRKDAASDSARVFLTSHDATKKVQSIPEWMEPPMTLYGGFRIRDILELYEIQK